MSHFNSCFLSDNPRNIPEKHERTVYKTFVINLEHRINRRIRVDKVINENNIDTCNLNYYKAIDGKKIKRTEEITQLFKENDFGWRRGMIGCALSHYNLWKELETSDELDFLVILEDDIKTCKNNFNSKFTNLINTNKEKDPIHGKLK